MKIKNNERNKWYLDQNDSINTEVVTSESLWGKQFGYR